MGLSRAVRLAQCHSARITLRGSVPVQVDGEPWLQPAATIIVAHAGQVRRFVLCTRFLPPSRPSSHAQHLNVRAFGPTCTTAAAHASHACRPPHVLIYSQTHHPAMDGLSNPQPDAKAGHCMSGSCYVPPRTTVSCIHQILITNSCLITCYCQILHVSESVLPCDHTSTKLKDLSMPG